MNLDPKKRKPLRELILSNFKERVEMRIILDECLNRNYDTLVSPNDIRAQYFELIKYFETEGQLKKFLQELVNNRANNQSFIQELSKLMKYDFEPTADKSNTISTLKNDPVKAKIFKLEERIQTLEVPFWKKYRKFLPYGLLPILVVLFDQFTKHNYTFQLLHDITQTERIMSDKVEETQSNLSEKIGQKILETSVYSTVNSFVFEKKFDEIQCLKRIKRLEKNKGALIEEDEQVCLGEGCKTPLNEAPTTPFKLPEICEETKDNFREEILFTRNGKARVRLKIEYNSNLAFNNPDIRKQIDVFIRGKEKPPIIITTGEGDYDEIFEIGISDHGRVIDRVTLNARNLELGDVIEAKLMLIVEPILGDKK